MLGPEAIELVECFEGIGIRHVFCKGVYYDYIVGYIVESKSGGINARGMRR